MAPDVVAELAHEGVAVAVAVLLLRRRRVGAPPLGAAVEHLCLGRRPAAMSAQQARCGRPRERWPSSSVVPRLGGCSWQ